MSGEVPSPGRRLKRISVSLTDDLYIGLEELAEDRGIGVSDAAREAISSYLLTEHWGQTIGSLAEAEINKGLTNEEVLKAVTTSFPHAKTTRESIAWYRSRMRRRDSTVPTDREARVKREAS